MRFDETLDAHSGIYFAGERIDSRQTAYQLIEVFDTPALGKLMRIDGANMVSERDEFFYHENLVHPTMVAHPSPQRVLIIGGGDGGSLEEILKYRTVERVLLAELDQGVIDVARQYFQSVHRGAFYDPRVEIRIGDGMALVRESVEKFDLIFLDLTDPVGPAEALYTQSFYADCKRSLATGGALVLHIGSPFSHASRVRKSLETLRATFSEVEPWFVHIPAYGATWGFAMASDTLNPRRLTAAKVDEILHEKKIGDRQFYNGDMHTAMLAQPEYIKAVIS